MYIIDRQREITQSLLKSPNHEELLRFLVKKGMLLAPIHPEFKSDDYLLPGCDVKIWLEGHLLAGKFAFSADAESRIIKGVLYLLLEIYQGSSAEEIIAAGDDFMTKGQWPALLSQSRRNGLSHIVKTIRGMAERALAATD